MQMKIKISFSYYLICFLIVFLNSCQKEEEIRLPVIITKEVINITPSSAISGGIITDDGGAPVAVRGICWDTSPNPEVNLNGNQISDYYGKTSDGLGIGEFSSELSGLWPGADFSCPGADFESTYVFGATYYVRAYAVNSLGVSYGEQREFTTLPFRCPE